MGVEKAYLYRVLECDTRGWKTRRFLFLPTVAVKKTLGYRSVLDASWSLSQVGGMRANSWPILHPQFLWPCVDGNHRNRAH